jgi:hypothetical protein
MKDRYLARDRLKRHTEDAIARVDDKLAYWRGQKGKDALAQIVKLKAKVARLKTNFAVEAALTSTFVRNIESAQQ